MDARRVSRIPAIAAAFGLAWSVVGLGPNPALAQKSAQTRSQAGAAKDHGSALGEFGSNKEPIKIDSDRLDVFDRDGKAVFTGNVVAVQGDSTMRCTALTVFYEQKQTAGATKPEQAAETQASEKPAASGRPDGAGSAGPSKAGSGGVGGLSGGQNSIKKIDCKGPVTVVSKTQVATGDHAEFDKAANRVYLTGNAALSDGPNVTRGERVVYDLNTGIANIEGGRVRALIVPGSQKQNGSARKER